MRLILLAGLTALACARPDAEADPVAQPEPEADADADAEAEAKAEADAQNWMGQNIQGRYLSDIFLSKLRKY